MDQLVDLRAQELLALDSSHLWHPYTPADDGEPPLIVARAEGPFFWTRSGRRFIDANSSWWVAALGHRHPAVLAALRTQLESLTHIALGGLTHEPAILLAKELVCSAPGFANPSLPSGRELTRVFFSDDGSTAVEVALKLAVQYWAQNGRSDRAKFVALADAFHGETVGASSVGGIAVFRDVYKKMLFPVDYVPAPIEANDGRGIEVLTALALGQLRGLLEREEAQIAGVIVEPLVLGAAGMKMYPPAFLEGIRALCTEFDTFFIADEVFTGLGRTGTLWASDQASVVPDILCTAKALSGAMFPFAATIASERIYDGFRGSRERAFLYGHSYAGNPLGCAVALAVLRCIRDERVLEGIVEKSATIRASMKSIASETGAHNPRALGMIGAIDLGTSGYRSTAALKIYRHALELGLYLRPLGDTVYVAPPLNIPNDALEELLALMRLAVLEGSKA